MRQAAGTAGLLAAGLLAFSGLALGADPALMNMVMPNAKILAGVNVTSAKNSPLGQFLISAVQGQSGQGPAGLQSLIAATGFDPFTDVTEVLAASAADPATPGALVLLDGTFDAGKIAAALQSRAGQQVQIDTTTYPGTTMIVFTDTKAKVSPAVAFVGSGIAVAGDAASVQAALVRSSGVNSIDPALAARVSAFSGDDAWMAGDAPIASLLSGNAASSTAGQALQMLQSIEAYSAAVKLGSTVQAAAQLQANSPQNAEALENVLKLVVSLGAMDAAKNPQLGTLIQLLQQLQVSHSGADLNVALSVSETVLEDLLKSMVAPAKPANGN